MLLRLSASKDTFVTNKVVGGKAVSGSNAGASEILQVWKIASPAQQANILIAFDSAAVSAVTASASWTLSLTNVETENPNGGSFTLQIYPIQSQWDEGKGQDLDYWTDKGFANWSYAKNGSQWISGGFPSTTGGLPFATQSFDIGHENLSVDVTNLIQSATSGFWISISSTQVDDANDYYLKAFRSRQTHFPQYQPYLEARWSDFTGSYESALVDIVDSTGIIVGGIYNLKSVYDRSENPILRLHLRPKDWNLSVVTTASSATSGTILTNAYYRIIENFSDEVVVPFGSGAVPYTRLSWNDDGNYFQFPMQNLAPNLTYRFDIGYTDIDGEWHVMRDDTTFRVK